jgi:hypothetical protein
LQSCKIQPKVKNENWDLHQFYHYFCRQQFSDMKKLNLFLSLAIITFLSSCSVGRYLDQPAYLYVEGVSSVSIGGESQKYINWHNQEMYSVKFNSELDSQLATYNIMITNNASVSYDRIFSVRFTDISLHETYTIETLYPDSLSNIAETYYLSDCSVSADFDVYSGIENNGSHIKSGSVSSFKEEELSNKRTFWQILFGTNKDNSEYHYKELSEDVFDELCEKTARKAAAKISRIISRELK